MSGSFCAHTLRVFGVHLEQMVLNQIDHNVGEVVGDFSCPFEVGTLNLNWV